ncbi:2Fe-2S iron-sulfur cluster-binding protein [Undibacterium fentianense]|uniref:2Fe-2S iron-sulfur cluster binding domain-containing protein n=1 Tax=Undibacterium fentianense TaxID=2828728 RepID=A0A941DY90_9BURK|nr:2Fe-2S iron-sulfur cluster-binding protein [Undibacterium fentianense]MBR7798955.1 2Fe-2S iron-sulfur cluster binding domain-containing protein [Undibacterium fentianense]
MSTENSREFRVTLIKQNREFVCNEGEPILLAALRQGVRPANSCRNGSCRTCLCKTKLGEVYYQIEWPSLSFDEKQDGYILPCVAIARSDIAILDWPIVVL